MNLANSLEYIRLVLSLRESAQSVDHVNQHPQIAQKYADFSDDNPDLY